MAQTMINPQILDEYGEFLLSCGLSKLTQEQYVHDARVFIEFLRSREITPEVLKEFKAQLLAKYNAVSVKALICGVNKYLEFMDSPCRMEHVKQQAKSESDSGTDSDAHSGTVTKEEYLRVLKAVKHSGDDRLYLIVETICGTGLKFSELKFLTAEAVREGRVVLPTKRNVYLSKNLCRELQEYCRNNGVCKGTVLLTRHGNLPDRANISRAIKSACQGTGIEPEKLSTKALREYYYRNFESFRGEMVNLMDEDWRGARFA